MEEEQEDTAGAAVSSSPNNSASSFPTDFSAHGDHQDAALGVGGANAYRSCSRASDDDGGGSARKKLRLTKEQAVFLEDSFKEHITFNPKLMVALAKQLNLRPRQVVVWFQNRRAKCVLERRGVDERARVATNILEHGRMDVAAAGVLERRGMDVATRKAAGVLEHDRVDERKVCMIDDDEYERIVDGKYRYSLRPWAALLEAGDERAADAWILTLSNRIKRARLVIERKSSPLPSIVEHAIDDSLPESPLSPVSNTEKRMKREMDDWVVGIIQSTRNAWSDYVDRYDPDDMINPIPKKVEQALSKLNVGFRFGASVDLNRAEEAMR